jgi:hypothetical protein
VRSARTWTGETQCGPEERWVGEVGRGSLERAVSVGTVPVLSTVRRRRRRWMGQKPLPRSSPRCQTASGSVHCGTRGTLGLAVRVPVPRAALCRGTSAIPGYAHRQDCGGATAARRTHRGHIQRRLFKFKLVVRSERQHDASRARCPREGHAHPLGPVDPRAAFQKRTRPGKGARDVSVASQLQTAYYGKYPVKTTPFVWSG